MGVRENWVVPPGLTPDTASQSGAEAPGYFRSSLRDLGHSSPFPSAEQLAEKVVEGARSTPQALKHGRIFRSEAPGYFRSSLRDLGHSSPFPSAEQLAEKVVEGARSTPQALKHGRIF